MREAVARLVYRLGGVDVEAIRLCSDGNRSAARLQGWITIASWVFIVGILYFCASVLFDQTGAIQNWWVANVAYLGFAILGSVLKIGFDAYFVRSLWVTHGMKELAEAGVDYPARGNEAGSPDNPRRVSRGSSTGRSFLRIVSRLAISVGFSYMISIVLVMSMLRADIERRHLISINKNNDDVKLAISRLIDKDVADRQNEIDRGLEKIAEMRRQIEQGNAPRFPSAEDWDPEIRRINQRSDNLATQRDVTTNRKASLLVDAERLQELADSEERGGAAIHRQVGGVMLFSGVDGIQPVQGGRRERWVDFMRRKGETVAQIRLADSEIARIDRSVDSLLDERRQRMRLHQEAFIQHQQDIASLITSRRTEIGNEIRQKSEEIVLLRERREKKIASYNEIVNEMLVKDANYIPPTFGVLARLREFDKVNSDLHPKWTWGIALMLMVLELSPILTKMLNVTPSYYAKFVANREVIGASETIGARIIMERGYKAILIEKYADALERDLQNGLEASEFTPPPKPPVDDLV